MKLFNYINMYRLLVLIIILSFCPLSSAQKKDNWHDNQSKIRMVFSTVRGPSHPSGGYIAIFPSGGILPRGPAITVYDSTGKSLKNALLWHDPSLAGAIICENTGAGTIYVYFKEGAPVKWTPETGLHPSVVVFSCNGQGNLSAAQQLASSIPGKGVFFYRNPLGLRLGGNPSGLGGPFFDYLLGYMVTFDPGKTFLAPAAWNGSVSFLFDGKPITPQKVFEQQGGVGQWVDIDKQPHRVEWFHVHNGGQASVQVTWRRPNATPTELGAPTPTNKAAWASGLIPGNAFIYSGQANVEKVEALDNDQPVAAFHINPSEYFWFEDNEPMILYIFSVMPQNPPKTTFSWTFGPDLQITNKQTVSWLMTTGRKYSVGLKAVKGEKTSSCEYQFDAFCDGQRNSSINDRDTRIRYREALFNMLDACPLNKDVFSEWSPSMWDLFWRLIEPGYDRVIAHIFAKRWDIAQKKLSPDKIQKLQDLYIPMISPIDANKALEWISKFEKNEKDIQRKNFLYLKKAEVYMYYQPNFKEAEALAARVAAVFASPYRNVAAIRLADIAFLKGDMDQAIKLYSEVQKRVKHSQQIAEKKETMESSGGLARSKAELKAQREKQLTPSAIGSLRSIKDWRIGAIRDTSVTETTRNLLKQGYITEARQSLEKWEQEFPLSKLSGDYIIVEAMFFMKIMDYVRANAILTAYCQNIDMSNYLAEAMELKIECMVKLKIPEKEMKPFLEDVKKRLPYHPVGENAANMLRAMRD